MINRTVIVLSVLFILSCGIKGPPLPPLTEETIQRQKGEKIQFSVNENSKIISADDSLYFHKKSQKK